MLWMLFFAAYFLLFPFAHTYDDDYFGSYTKQNDHSGIRKFIPKCEPKPGGRPCPKEALKPEGKQKSIHTKPLTDHWVEVYDNYDPSTNRINMYKRFPNAQDLEAGGVFYLGRGNESFFKQYETDDINPPVKDNCFCGIRNNRRRKRTVRPEKENKIIGGTHIDPHLYPYLGSMTYAKEGNHFCGATLINNLYVITAAHCLDDLMHDDFVVRLGAHRGDAYPNNLEQGEQVKQVQFVIIHFRFSRESGNTDVALVRFKTPATYNNIVSPVCFPPTVNWVYENNEVRIPGWGVEDVSSQHATNTPKEAVLKVMSRKTCVKNSKYPPDMIKMRNLCAAAKGQDSCQGDSGGPMLVELEDGRDGLLGVVSWGIGCDNEDFPGVYCKVQSRQLVHFLWFNTKDAKYCV